MRSIVVVVGQGQLADIVSAELSAHYKIIRHSDVTADVPKNAELVLVLHDDWPSSGYLEVEEMMQKTGMLWLRGAVLEGEGMVGPLVRPGIAGCSQCADNRRLTAGGGRLLLADRGMHSGANISRSALWQIAHLLAEETHRVLQGTLNHTEEHMYIINLKTLNSSLHFVLPDPLCAVCGLLPDDSSATIRIDLKPRPKPSIESYRCRPLDGMKEVLLKSYYDSRTGLFNEKLQDLISPFAVVNVNLPSFLMGDEVTGGRSHLYAESELTAILEGLERYCGQAPRGKRAEIYDSYNNVSDQALDPAKVGLYSKEQYEHPDFPFERFDPDLPIEWIWGYSFLKERPILVPQTLAYYSSGFGAELVQEGSNGCAIGASLEEAIFYGVLEVVERDSFLMTWYAQLPVPRLDPYSAKDKELQLMVERLRAVAGYDVHLFNTTMENGIPSIWALAKSARPGNMNLICGAGAHIDPVRAAKSAIHELAAMILFLQEKFDTGREQLLQMFHNSFLVQQMECHALLYGLPQAEERLRFLLDAHRPLRTFDAEFKRKEPHADLTDDLKEIIQVFRGLNLDVVVVDQSSPETLKTGLYCVKVLIPGMLPMTFGHHLTRVSGLERALRIPAKLGYTKAPLTVGQLNPHPHPFL